MPGRLILFARSPRLGKVKTRLVPPLSAEQALGLYRAFLIDQLRFVHSFEPAHEVELCLDGPWSDGHRAGLPPEGIRVSPQGAGDLGVRMLGAFERSWKEGSPATVIVGADCPSLPAERVSEAFVALASAPAVVVPAEDGGYVLIGLRRPLDDLFRDVPWGGPQVMQVTRRRAAAAACDLVELDAWHDIDEGGDLERLRGELAGPGRLRAPRTARFLDSLDRPS